MNTELLLRVKEKILSEPEKLDMETWYEDFYQCDTVACIGGWACALAGEKIYTHMPESEALRLATKVLDLPLSWPELLFFPAGWFEPYKTWYFSLSVKLAGEEELPQKLAELTAEYIDFFIAKHQAWEEKMRIKPVKPEPVG